MYFYPTLYWNLKIWSTLFAKKIISKKGSVLSLAYSTFSEQIFQFIPSSVFIAYVYAIFFSECVTLVTVETKYSFCQQNTDTMLSSPINKITCHKTFRMTWIYSVALNNSCLWIVSFCKFWKYWKLYQWWI